MRWSFRLLGCRIIPARAGQTMPLLKASALLSDHPRACGANIGGRVPGDVPAGSSPRVRGKQSGRWRPASRRRIIPARAGQTITDVKTNLGRTDHPRACGANVRVQISQTLIEGSSPRVRGKRFFCSRFSPATRIIPARAGQTSSSAFFFSSSADHPRACGANLALEVPELVEIGSSPRVRGKPIHIALDDVTHRIIPARAGQTRRRQQRCYHQSDHPRACGANWHVLA